VDLKALLLNSLKMVKEKALKHKLQLLTDIGEIPTVISGDERKLKQIVYNLLSNAVKFTPDGGKITVAAGRAEMDAVESMKNGRYVQVSVSDTGIGLLPEHLQRIFEPFEQVEDHKRHSSVGTGLGLAITKEFVEMHGGRIWAVSEGEGMGATFNVVIPVANSGRSD
jgi:signal transduction histidine kinase